MNKWFYPNEDMSVEVSNTFHVGGGYVLKIQLLILVIDLDEHIS